MMLDTKLYLLDTNVISDMMRNPVGTAAQHALLLAANEPSSKVCTSVVAQCELLFGLRRRTSPHWSTQYSRVMASIDVLDLESTVATHYADLRTHLELAGTLIGPNDTLIAAHALALGATLVSGDAEFARVPGMQVENWLASVASEK
ncbi:type II toxin-antitoxin system VapC family toxin [Rhodoferax sp.]|uniref:type II toxin-antitoxin system VapC family toxin n=1 Tax=Rhodoferax sp. TaxID=50421 RepID=UPI002612F163|nr:type II toxin-antitoxin system VapC family toxin [Rhodoferax sp.]MDD2920276.1 type II toxin-antitoxin system VapC family toxin [Rhodoferax sp.]